MARENYREDLVIRRVLAEGQHQVVSHGLYDLHVPGELFVVMIRHVGHVALLWANRLPETGAVISELQQVLQTGTPLVPLEFQVPGLVPIVAIVVTVVIAVVAVPVSFPCAVPIMLRCGYFLGHLCQVEHHAGVVVGLAGRTFLMGNHLHSPPKAHYLKIKRGEISGF